MAKGLQDMEKHKWDHIFIFPPSKDFVDDGCRYMKQASMDERTKNFLKLQALVNEFYPEVSKTYLNGTFLENFNEVKNYINGLFEA
jgi:nicotinamide riboside kinase